MGKYTQDAARLASSRSSLATLLLTSTTTSPPFPASKASAE